MQNSVIFSKDNLVDYNKDFYSAKMLSNNDNISESSTEEDIQLLNKCEEEIDLNNKKKNYEHNHLSVLLNDIRETQDLGESYQNTSCANTNITNTNITKSDVAKSNVTKYVRKSTRSKNKSPNRSKPISPKAKPVVLKSKPVVLKRKSKSNHKDKLNFSSTVRWKNQKWEIHPEKPLEMDEDAYQRFKERLSPEDGHTLKLAKRRKKNRGYATNARNSRLLQAKNDAKKIEQLTKENTNVKQRIKRLELYIISLNHTP